MWYCIKPSKYTEKTIVFFFSNSELIFFSINKLCSTVHGSFFFFFVVVIVFSIPLSFIKCQLSIIRMVSHYMSVS